MFNVFRQFNILKGNQRMYLSWPFQSSEMHTQNYQEECVEQTRQKINLWSVHITLN